MVYGSVCSGIEAASVAWSPLGFKPAWFSEIDPFCSALLKHHYPGVPNRGDFTQIQESERFVDLRQGNVSASKASRTTTHWSRTLHSKRAVSHGRGPSSQRMARATSQSVIPWRFRLCAGSASESRSWTRS